MNFPANPHVDHIFREWDRPGSPGMSLAVSQHGKIIYSHGYGFADLGRNIKNDAETVFHAASLSKQFTAMAIMLLVDKGKLSLNDDVRKFIPQVASAIPKITIREMLHHTSGMRDSWVLATMAGWRLSDDTITEQDVVDGFVAHMKTLNFKPSSDFSYSNTPYALASLIVKKLSGQSLAEFSQTHIFKPLGMSRTTIIETHGQIVHDRAYGYKDIDSTFQVMMPNYDLTGPTNLQTTVEDLMRWAQNFDDKTVGGDAAFSEMLTPGLGFPAPYGLGLYIKNNKDMPVVEHDGRDAGYRSHLMLLPKQQLAIALLCNVALADDDKHSTWILVRDVAKAFLGKDVPMPDDAPAAPPSAKSHKKHPLTDYVGRYHSEEIGSTYLISQSGPSSLALTRWKYPPTKLVASGTDTFEMSDFSVELDDVRVTFERDKRDQIEAFSMDDISGENRLAGFRFTKVK
jgi:CubicO group peptidase (beta-lactamase class C family)